MSIVPPNQAVPVQIGPQPEETSHAPARFGTPLWWVQELIGEMDRRQSLVMLQEDYFAGRHKMTFASSAFRDANAPGEPTSSGDDP